MSDKGIENLKKLADFIIGIANGISQSLSDGAVNLSDAFNFKDALIAAFPAFKGISRLAEEYFDLEPSETEELKKYIGEKLQLGTDSDKAEAIAEAVLSVIIDLNSLVKELLKD